MGGGTCYNGGWLPPGIPIPTGNPQPQPPPSPDPPPDLPPGPEPGPEGCMGPDPFVGLTDLVGECIDGAWIPVQVLTSGGSVHVVPTSDGDRLVLETDTGLSFEMLGELPPNVQDGDRVFVQGRVRIDKPAGDFGPLLEVTQISGS